MICRCFVQLEGYFVRIVYNSVDLFGLDYNALILNLEKSNGF